MTIESEIKARLASSIECNDHAQAFLLTQLLRAYNELVAQGLTDTNPNEIVYQNSPISYDFRAGYILYGYTEKHKIRLTQVENEIMKLFAQTPNTVIPFSKFTDHLWPNMIGAENNLRVHIYGLRTKIEPEPGLPRHIRSRRGFGYFFTPSDVG